MSDKRFKLFHYPATRSSRVKWLLHELLDEDFEVEVVPLYDGAQYQDEYLAKNPNHSVPTLEIKESSGDSRYMIESSAMVVFLADAYPERKLAPPPTPASFARADYLQAIHFAGTWADMMLWQIRLHEHLLMPDKCDPRTIERYRNKFQHEAEPQLKARVSQHRYACGDQFCAADCVVGQIVLWARAYGMCRDEVFKEYTAALFERPAFQKAYADLGEFTLEVPPAQAAFRAMVTG